MRDETQYVAAVKDAGASEGEDRAQSSYYSAHRTDADKLTVLRGPAPGESEAAAVTIPITPGWDQRPGADLPHFDQLACMGPRTLFGWVDKMRAAVLEAVAPESACIPLCIIAGTIVTAFGLGWFFGSTWYSSRTASSSPPGVVSEKRAVSITGSVGSSVPAPAAPTSRSVTTSPADARKASLSAARLSPLVPTTALDGQQATSSLATSASQGELKSGPRLTPAPETRPATIDGWTVREVYGGAAVLIGTDRVWTVRPGDYVPGVGRIDTITRWGSRWIVVTTGGLISTQ